MRQILARLRGRKPARPPSKNTLKGVSQNVLVLLVATWLVVVDNLSFWRGFAGAQDSFSPRFWGSAFALALVLVLVIASVLRVLSVGRLIRPVLIVALIASASTAHFVDGWGVLIDKAMIRNLLETDWKESRDLMTVPLFLDNFLRGILPAIAVALVPLRTLSPVQWAKSVVAFWIVAAVLFGTSFVAFNSIYAPTFRAHRELRLQLVPSNAINGAMGLMPKQATRNRELQKVGQDATQSRVAGRKPLLTVLVVGETARAANFSLGGYDKPTNAPLMHENVSYLNNVISCGTDTATSLPCMFSNLGIGEFSVERARSRENVLDVLSRAGVAVSWIDNNSGCKGVCERIKTITPRDLNLPNCNESVCYDETLVTSLEQNLPSPATDAMVVLHLQGSHGPAYFKRYPQPGPFQPTCDTSRIQDCSSVALVNTYDNTIEYTSQVLDSTIHALKRLEGERDVVMVYVSDHGESLGENGLFLHGMPMMLAPKEQYKVPMIFWLSKGAERRIGVNRSCMAAIESDPWTHDNLFHTLLGLKTVTTMEYKQSLDIFALARAKGGC